MSKYLTISECENLVDVTLEFLGCEDLVERIHVKWNNRYTNRYGTANYYSKTIQLSKKLFPIIDEHERYDTIIHETCHIADRHLGNLDRKKSHGPTWKALMIKCGLEPNRCKSLLECADAKEVYKIKTYYQFTCPCGNTGRLGKIKYSRTLKFERGEGTVRYLCSRCKTPITLDRITPLTG